MNNIFTTVRPIFFYCLISLFLISLGCKTPASVNQQTSTTSKEQANQNDSLLTTIERTACYGRCPMYKAEIYTTGFVKYSGKRFVDKVGEFTTYLSKEKIASIKQKIEEVGYFKLNDSYPSSIADIPSTLTSVHLDGKKKNILNKQNAPKELRDFEQYLEKMLEDNNWKKLEDTNH